MFLTFEPFRPLTNLQIPEKVEDYGDDEPQVENVDGEVHIEIEEHNTTKASDSPQTPVESKDDTFEFKPVTNQVNPQIARMRYLQRLAHKQVWLNPLQ